MKIVRNLFAVFLLLVVALASAFHLRVEHLTQRPLPEARAVEPASATHWYFAYGSNMSTRYLYNVRGVYPAESNPGAVSAHEVTLLGPGLNGLEPAFAYLVKAQGKKAYGVVHRVSAQDLDRVKESEGPNYQWVRIPVKLANGQEVAAQTLLRLTSGTEGMPSRRYLELLLEGAQEHGLPEAYIAKLRAHPSVYFPFASELLGDIIEAVVMKRSGKCATLLLDCGP